MANADRIQKTIVLRARRDRVWRAITDSKEFGNWFGVEFERPFVSGERITGTITPTKVDAHVAEAQKPHAGKSFECTVERIEPMRLFSFRWHPFAVADDVDPSKEPSTLVVFELEEVADGTKLTITESGFERIPLERRAKAFNANDEGWTAQAGLLEKYLGAEEEP